MKQLKSSIEAEEKEIQELMQKAQEIMELFQRAIKLGYSISLSPEQMKTFVEICELAELIKGEK